MIDFGPHANYIIIAYLGALFVVLGLIFKTIKTAAFQKKRLKDLENKGVYRRSKK